MEKFNGVNKDMGKHAPKRIQEAKYVGDVSYLRNAGRQGGLAAARKREKHAVIEEALEFKRHEEEEERRKATGEDVIPLDTYN